jgi:DNA (cytosine-5)-methyltransferase 1
MILRAGHKLAPNLIPEFERCVRESAPGWFLMENVQDAPEPVVDGYLIHSQLLRDVWVGGETTRLRRFSFGTQDGRHLEIEMLALHRPDPEPAVLACGGARSVPIAIGGSGKVKANRRVKAGDIASRLTVAISLRRSGLPEDFFGPKSPFKVEAQQQMIGNGVPLAMGRAVAQAVVRATARRTG